MSRPLGYFLSWGTYGTRLHGDPRGTVDRTNTTHGDPVLGPDEERWEDERGQMKFPPVVLTREQRLFAEDLIPTICERGLWTYCTCAVAPDHVHVILTSEHEPKTIRRILKRWLGQSMSERWPLAEGATWWAECGSIKWLVDAAYFENATGYVSRQRTK
jgi:REP element-mobilizing transposase RayT